MDTKGVGSVAVLVFLGLIAGAVGFMPAYEHNIAVQEGEPATATVLSTDVDVRTDDEGEESYSPVVTYEYVVDGRTYESDNTFPGRFSRWKDSRSWAERVVGQYAPGDEVTIHSVPSDPANAYLRNDGPPGSWLFGVGYAVVGAVGGVWLIRTGFRRWRQRRLIADTPTENVRSLSVGPSELKGRARSTERGSITAPFSEEDCLVAKYEIEQYEEDNDDGGSWRTIEEGVLHVPFALEDDTGRVLVEPDDDAVFDLDPDDWTTTYVDSGDRGPAPIQEFVRATQGLDFPSNRSGKDHDRRYKQNLVRTDESVYVFGSAVPREDVTPGASNAERLVVRMTDERSMVDGPMFLLSDDTEQGLTDRRRFALWRGPVGAFFLIVALSFTLGILGPDFGITLPVLF